MKRFESWDGIEIAYREWGEVSAVSAPVVLHHGFVADAQSNWVATGVVEALVAAGRKVIAPDVRGHGRSEKPHDQARYGEQRMARDLAVLLDQVGVRAVDLVGYSMGAIVALILSSRDRRVRRLVVGGVGSGVIECGGVDRRAVSNESIIEALDAEDPASIETPEGRDVPDVGGRPARRPGGARRAGEVGLQRPHRARSDQCPDADPGRR